MGDIIGRVQHTADEIRTGRVTYSMEDAERIKAASFHDVPVKTETPAIANPDILTMFHVSDDETFCVSGEVRPDINDMTIDNGEFELTLSFAEIEAWLGCLQRARDLLLYHKAKKEGK